MLHTDLALALRGGFVAGGSGTHCCRVWYTSPSCAGLAVLASSPGARVGLLFSATAVAITEAQLLQPCELSVTLLAR